MKLVHLIIILCYLSFKKVYLEIIESGNVTLVTVATNYTEGLQRYLYSARTYKIEPVVLGLGDEWLGGDIRYYSGGGQKLRLLKNYLKPYKNDVNKIIVFTDAYDVMVLSSANVISEKFKKFNARIVISSEKSCWPDKSLADKYPPGPELGYRFVNSGGFIGYANDIYQMLSTTFEDDSNDIDNDDDDQLFLTKVYLNFRDQLNILLDHRGDIFQNLFGVLDNYSTFFDDTGNGTGEIQLEFENNNEHEAKLKNLLTGAKPLFVHGNGRSKQALMRLGNYLAKAWTGTDGCRLCLIDNIDLSKFDVNQYPTVLLSIFIEQPTPFVEEFFEKIQKLDYPKNKIHLFIHNSVQYHAYDVEEFLKKTTNEYASVKEILPNDSVNEWNARNLALEHFRKKHVDYYFNVDVIVQIDNPDTLRLLIQQNRTIVAPLVKRPGKPWSNFWGALSTSEYYARSFDYMDIVENKKRGLWNVPFMNSIYLINSSIHNYFPRDKINAKFNYVFDNLDADMAFCARLRDMDIFMHVSNRYDFGHLINPETFDTSLAVPNLFQIYDNKLDWEGRYIHPEYKNNFLPNKVPLQPCPDVFWFPITKLKFCIDLITLVEHFGKWSDGSNRDPRLKNGYEAVPTRDIHMNQVGFDTHWLYFLKEYVRPLQELVFTGYYHDPPRSLMNFVVRYKPDEQPSLRPHHDSSTYTVNLALNTRGVDYEGGGCKFIRYNCSVMDTRPGWLLMHPGRLTHFHEGLPVLKGTRYIMISFVDP